MAHYEVGFKLQHDCSFNRLSKKFPSAVLAWWTNFDQDVLEGTTGAPDTLREYQSELQKAIREMGGRVARSTITDSKCQLVVGWDGTKWEYSTSRAFVKHNCLVLQPTVHTGGWEWYRVVAFSERDMKSLFKELDRSCEIEVVSKKTVDDGTVRDTFVITTSNLLGGLTGNQAEALVVALDSGYYTVPKKSTTEAVAARVGLPRTTFEEHLRKAESKVMMSVAPYMQFSVRRPGRGRGAQSRTHPRPAIDEEF
jgi:predicted DNA binding protein